MTIRNIDVTIKGPLFDKRIDKVVQDAIIDEAVTKIGDRLTRKGAEGSGGKGLGVRRNVVTRKRAGLVEEITSTTRRPRTTGRKWDDKNKAIGQSMAGRVIRKAAARIVGDLS